MEAYGQERQLLTAEFESRIAALKDVQRGSSGLEDELESLRSIYNDNLQQLSTKCATIEELTQNNNVLQKRVDHLEEMVAWTKQNSGKDVDRLFDDFSTTRKNHDDMALRLGERVETCLRMGSDIITLEKKNAELKQSLREVEKESAVLRTTQPQTLRLLLILRLLETSFSQKPSDNNTDANQETEVWWPNGLCHRQLDEICNPASASFRDMINLLPRGPRHDYFYRRLEVVSCDICSKQKFKFKPGMHPRAKPLTTFIHEFPSRSSYFSCCYEEVCRSCLLEHVVESLKYQWWCNLQSLQWIHCPSCTRVLSIRCEADLRVCLEQNGSTEVEKLVRMYEKVVILRQALGALDPRPSDEALMEGGKLYSHLVKFNRVYNYFDPIFDAIIDENGCIPDFKPGVIFNAKMESDPSPVPLFLKLFRRRPVAKECIICSAARYEIDYTDVKTWNVECEPYKGAWMWDILVFPTNEIQHCDHDFDVCKVCTAQHLRSTLESGGPNACERLSCPQCDRRFIFHEVLKLADSDTVARYERFVLQKLLEKDPNYRECLRASCPNGQLYENMPLNPHIFCEECGFEMCFNHRVPWHKGKTCDEYDNRHNENEAAELSKVNIKKCPGCNKYIQKDGGCFHMTCKSLSMHISPRLLGLIDRVILGTCGHEFCWECFVQWDKVRSKRDGHRAGCFFRTSNLSPLQVRGSNLEAALGETCP
ncbi:hypothetical protein V8E54_008258 [Elaphomyces granulatus]